MNNAGISETTGNLPDLEKSGKMLLLQSDIDQFNQGILSERIKTVWGLTWAQLQEAIKEGNFEILQG